MDSVWGGGGGNGVTSDQPSFIQNRKIKTPDSESMLHYMCKIRGLTCLYASFLTSDQSQVTYWHRRLCTMARVVPNTVHWGKEEGVRGLQPSTWIISSSAQRTYRWDSRSRSAAS